VQTHVVTGYETHPIREYVEAGVAVTVNTDNRLFSHTTVTDELWLVHERCGVSAEHVREIVLNGFRHAFLPWEEKEVLLAEVAAALAVPVE
jgi:adenosine deaminase